MAPSEKEWGGGTWLAYIVRMLGGIRNRGHELGGGGLGVIKEKRPDVGQIIQKAFLHFSTP